MMFTMPAGTHQQAAAQEAGRGDPAAGGTGPPVHTLAAVKRHRASIEAIAADLGRSVEEVSSVYQCELLRLSSQAAVADYLPVLVGKRVRQLYRRRLQAGEAGEPCAQLIGGTWQPLV